jgi:opacity protein-like surface antigen
VTADYRADARITALSSGSSYVHGYSTDVLKLESTTVLLNGYLDLGNWSGVTPYVGAGIGFAHNNLNSYWSQITCLTVTCSSAFSQARVPHETGSKNNLAWALMAGAAVDIGMGLKLDLGYRYLRVGESKTELDSAGFGFKTKPLDAHEARIGVRYMID